MPAFLDEAAHAVSQEAINAGVYVLAGGLEDHHKRSVIVATDGTVTDGQYPDSIGGITVLDVPSREQALEWATKVAVACRCAVGDGQARFVLGGEAVAVHEFSLERWAKALGRVV